MTIHKKLFKVETTGSRKTGDLKPKLVEHLPQGVHLAALKYNEKESWAIVLCWCSDHEILPVSERHSKAELDALGSKPSVLEVLPDDHPLMPQKPFTRIALAETIKTPFPDEKLPAPLKWDMTMKAVEFKGKQFSFIRRKQYSDTDGRTVQEYILEE